MSNNEFMVSTHNGITVVRDDMYQGGTKARIIEKFLGEGCEYVYPTPAYGYAQVALAYACNKLGKQATVFVAKRKTLHPRTQEAKSAGAKIVQIPYGYLSNVKSKATQYCEMVGANLVPFGFDFPDFRSALARLALSLDIEPPREVWTVGGSGTLTRSLQTAWPDAVFYCVRVGASGDFGEAIVLKAPEKFEQDAKVPPPFPSCSNYDAKAWRFIKTHASKGALFWNVAA